MELNLTKETLHTSETIYEGNVEQAIDSDITLPDYCPDIQRVLKCSLFPSITTTHTSGNRVTADGSALLRVLYVGENNNIKSYEISLPFSKYIENNEISQNTFPIVRANCEYVNCRVVSPRKLDVHGSISVCFKVFSTTSSEYLTDAEGCGVQLKKREHDITCLVGKIEKSFPLSEVAELPENRPSVGSIINITANAVVDDVKCIKNKFLLKGEMSISLIYCPEGENNDLEIFNHLMPISQIIEMDGVDESCTYNTYLDIVSLEVMIKADSSGEQRLIDINARICSVLSAYKEQKISLISDVYSVTNEIEFVEKNFETKQLLLNFSDNLLTRSDIDLSSLSMKSVLQVWAGEISVESSIVENEYVVSGSIDIGIIGINQEDKIIYTERQIDYKYNHSIVTSANKIICEPNVQIIAFEFSQTGDKLDVKAELSIIAQVVTISFEKAIDDIIINNNEEKRNLSPALTIYFSDSGESVWNIARKYNTTVDAIMSENNLSDEIIAENTMLLIPGI